MFQSSQDSREFVFTLDDDIVIDDTNLSVDTSVSTQTPAEEVETTAVTEDSEQADWELRLEQLRLQKRQNTLPENNTVTPASMGNTIVSQRRDDSQVAVNIAANNTQEELNQILDPVQRERAYRAFLNQWQKQTMAEQKHQSLDDPAILFEEDWLAAQEALQIDSRESQNIVTVRLHPNQEPEILSTTYPHDDDESTPKASTEIVSNQVIQQTGVVNPQTSIIDVHLHIVEPPKNAQQPTLLLSEKQVLNQLSNRLQNHLADAIAGMVRIAIQKQTAQITANLQHQILEELPNIIGETLEHNIAEIIKHSKPQS